MSCAMRQCGWIGVGMKNEIKAPTSEKPEMKARIRTRL